MARYRRYRRTIVRAPRKKWGSNMVDLDIAIANSGGDTASGYHAVQIAQNKTESTTPTPVIIKTGNFKVQADLYVNNSSVNAGSRLFVKCFIIFAPQGMEPENYSAATAIIQNHPEWIMAWRVLDCGWVSNGQNADFNKFSMSSRLKRNLNSGDSILCILIAENMSSSTSVGIKGLCQFWTCAN